MKKKFHSIALIITADSKLYIPKNFASYSLFPVLQGGSLDAEMLSSNMHNT
jgi:hypothetical protein